MKRAFSGVFCTSCSVHAEMNLSPHNRKSARLQNLPSSVRVLIAILLDCHALAPAVVTLNPFCPSKARRACAARPNARRIGSSRRIVRVVAATCGHGYTRVVQVHAALLAIAALSTVVADSVSEALHRRRASLHKAVQPRPAPPSGLGSPARARTMGFGRCAQPPCMGTSRRCPTPTPTPPHPSTSALSWPPAGAPLSRAALPLRPARPRVPPLPCLPQSLPRAWRRRRRVAARRCSRGSDCWCS